MSFTSLLTAFTNSVVSQNISSNKSVEINFILDFINHDLSATILVTAFVCWATDEKYALLSKLSEHNKYASIIDISVPTFNVEHYTNSENTLLLIDLDCPDSSAVLLQANNKNLFATPYKWLMLTQNNDFVINYEKYFLNYSFCVDSHVILAHKNKENIYSLTELYKYTNNSNFMLQRNMTVWEINTGFLNYRKYSTLQLNRINLNGTKIKASVVILYNDTLNHLYDYRFRHIDAVTKVNIILTDIIIDFINGTKEYNFVSTWGYLTSENNTYDGLLGDIQTNNAEIGTPLFMTPDRLLLVDYVAMTCPTFVRFVFRQPPLSYVTNVFTLPFARDVWLCYIGLCILATLLIYLAVKVEWSTSLGGSASSMLPSLSESFIVTIGAVAQQGASSLPRSSSGKILIFFTFTALMYLYVSYSANIVALLQSPATNIKTLNDLLNSNLKLGVQDVIYNRFYFEQETEPIRKAIYEQKVAPKGRKAHWMTLEEGVAKIRKGLFAFHAELNAIYKLMQETFYENEKCGIQEIQYIDLTFPYVPIKKNSTYKKIIKLGYRKLHESGIQSRVYVKLYPKKPECFLSNGGNFVIVGLNDVYAAFYVLLAGILTSVFLLLVEVCVHRKVK